MIIEGNKITAESGKILEKGEVTSKAVLLSKNDTAESWTERDMTSEEIETEKEEQERLSVLYADRVSELIREKYSLNDEIALSRQRDTKPEEFEEYFMYCEECKNKAKSEMEGIINE